MQATNGAVARGARTLSLAGQALVELGERIRAFRLDAALTQDSAARLAQMDAKRWQRIERGSANVTIKTLVKIALALGLTYWQLTAGDVPRSNRQRGPRTR